MPLYGWQWLATAVLNQSAVLTFFIDNGCKQLAGALLAGLGKYDLRAVAAISDRIRGGVHPVLLQLHGLPVARGG